jgi:hypothetical protein
MDWLKRRRGLLATGFALLAIVLVVSPALGGPSLRKLVKKEVAKQISKATGPQGPQGPAGAAGAAGAAGSARAWGSVQPDNNHACNGTPCNLNNSKGITSVIYQGNGLYCIEATGISSVGIPIIVSVDWNSTQGPEGNGSAMGLLGTGGICPAGNFGVRTMRIPSTGDNQSTNVNNVGFEFLIP